MEEQAQDVPSEEAQVKRTNEVECDDEEVKKTYQRLIEDIEKEVHYNMSGLGDDIMPIAKPLILGHAAYITNLLQTGIFFTESGAFYGVLAERVCSAALTQALAIVAEYNNSNNPGEETEDDTQSDEEQE